jgi:hypothetical protein
MGGGSERHGDVRAGKAAEKTRGKSGQREQAKGRFFFADSLNCGLTAVDLSLYAEGVVVNSSTDMALCWPTVCGTSDGETRRERVQM